ncbi:MAG: MFS transporter [Xanthobacteraceae bacterium]
MRVLSTASPDFDVAWFDRGADIPQLLRRPAKAAAPRAGSVAGSLRGLDWFTFFLADIQTGFGPFVAVYLTGQAWSQTDIGLVLTAGGLFALAAQMPGGAIVDAVRSRHLIASLAIAAICVSALTLAIWPLFPVVMAGRILQAGASCVLGPVIAALSLNLVGHAALGERLGRNARFASIGNGLAAAGMGVCGQCLSPRAVFVLTAALVLPALFALGRIRTPRTDQPPERRGEVADAETRTAPAASLLSVIGDKRLLIFAACVVLFHFANAATLPLMGSILTMRAGQWALGLTAACIVVPQIVVAGLSPFIGRKTQLWGRRPLLIVCFVALALRCVLFALMPGPYAVVATQAFDGLSAAILGVLFPLVVADITGGTGRFNLSLGFAGTAVGIGAALSTTAAGFTLDHFGCAATFFGLAGIAVAGLALASALMPETRPEAM